MLQNDPGKHRKGGDRHGGADKKHGHRKWCCRGEKTTHPQKPPCQNASEGERRKNTGDRDTGCRAEIGLEEIGAELNAHDKHVKGQPDLRDCVENGACIRGKEGVGQIGCDRAQERWPQQHARDHFPDHRRLAKALDDEAARLAGDQNDRQREEYLSGICGNVVHG